VNSSVAEPLYGGGYQGVSLEALVEPNDELVQLLENLLVDARSGKLQSVALATMTVRAGEVHTGSAYQAGRHAPSVVHLLGAVEVLKHRLLGQIVAG
jgi:hypothetical protein